jgi:hypothetical protein
VGPLDGTVYMMGCLGMSFDCHGRAAFTVLQYAPKCTTRVRGCRK